MTMPSLSRASCQSFEQALERTQALQWYMMTCNYPPAALRAGILAGGGFPGGGGGGGGGDSSISVGASLSQNAALDARGDGARDVLSAYSLSVDTAPRAPATERSAGPPPPPPSPRMFSWLLLTIGERASLCTVR